MNWLFSEWEELARLLLVALGAYVGLVLLLRISGKRTLSKMNAFDFVVTVALGSILATTMLSKDVSLAEGLSAFAVLILLQYSVTWLSVRSAGFKKFIKAEPTLLYYRGEYLAARRQQRVLEEDVEAAVRASGATLAQVEAVVLESNGTFSVLQYQQGQSQDAVLQGIHNFPPQ